MKNKKLLLALAISVILIFVFGCGAKVNVNEVRSYSDSITENLLMSMNHNDYEMFQKDLANIMKKAVSESKFPKLVSSIEGKIGKYIPGSKQFEKAYATGKYINVVYKTKFTKEESPVLVRVVFLNENRRHEITGIWFDSPKLRKK